MMQKIKSPLFGVPGNHDYWARIDFGIVARSFASTGGGWLMDDERLLSGGEINLIGATCTKPLKSRARTAATSILMIHYPYWVEQLAGSRFDLILAGHSHGGQVRLPFIGAILVPGGVGQYDLGLFKTPSGPLYVNAGIGYFYVNVRFNCRPEITVFEI
jgi:predicted MPP superfamily phosphohydrolase